MSGPEQNRKESEGEAESPVGDVEAAGETTAAATLGGDTSAQSPVGADTLVEVAGDPDPPRRTDD